MERFSLIIAAIIHDYLYVSLKFEIFFSSFKIIFVIRHPGTANQFEAQFNTDIFAIYKQEEGLLERYSIDKTFELMKKDNCNIVKGLSKEKLNKFTDLVKTLVMATDMQSHFKHYNDLNRFITANLNNKSKPSKATTMCWLLHCADISNGAKGKDYIIALKLLFKTTSKTYFRMECLFGMGKKSNERVLSKR